MKIKNRIKTITVKVLFSLIISILLMGSTRQSQLNYSGPHDNPGPATDIIHFSAFDVGIASKELESGKLDMYIYSLKTPAAQALKNRTDIEVYKAPASTVSIVLNPAPAQDGYLNPLSIREVRQAMQYIVNRDYISREIYKGFASPMISHVSTSDFDYLTVFELLKESKLTYDLDFAVGKVNSAMEEAGAKLIDNFWHYNGKQIDLKFIVRTEDERWDIGNEIRSNLSSLGFSINIIPQQFGPAIYTVYGTDPQLFEWHLYTEGWGKGGPQRYDYSNINQMCAPWLGNMPGWQEIGFWQYKSSSLDELGQKLFTGDFKNEIERNQLYIDITKACLDESIRLWVVTSVNNIPAKANIEGITEDIVTGPKGIWTIREAYNPDNPKELNIGNLWIWTNRTTWNPVGGFGDVYSNDIWNNVHDSSIATHPFNGKPIPFRSSYEVQTEGPNNKLTLPADAFSWDTIENQWRTVAQGTKATSKVTFDYSKYFESKWHHGQSIDIYDVIYPVAQLFDMVYNKNKNKIEFSIGTTSKPFTDTFRGFRITPDNQLEVYLDFWHFSDDYIAQYANVSGVTMPWEILAAMDNMVFEQRTATYSDTAASRFNLDPISLVLDKFSRLTRNTLRDFKENDFNPDIYFDIPGYSTKQNLDHQNRYASAIDWFKQKGHMVISNGPYILERFDSTAQYAQLKAFRDPNYPFKPGDLYYGKSQPIEIVEVLGDKLEKDKDITVNVDVNGPGTLGLKYVFQEPSSGTIISSGEANHLDSGTFQIIILKDQIDDQNLIYHLHIAAYSDELANLLEQKIDLEFESSTINEVVNSQKRTQNLESEDSKNNDSLKTNPVEVNVNKANSPVTMMIWVALISALITGSILLFFTLRSKRG
jgi:peptide/nickel transport system substrate-binding protein